MRDFQKILEAQKASTINWKGQGVQLKIALAPNSLHFYRFARSTKFFK